jgi:vitamin B12 transporter
LSNHSKFGNNFTYEISPSYKFTNLLVYASISSAFNAPSVYQLYDPTKGYGAYTSKGNPLLKPEESLSFEIGVKKEFENGSYFTISSFASQTRNAIEYVYLWQQGKPVDELGYMDYLGDTYINVTRQFIKGIELAGLLKVGKFYLNANATFMDGEVKLSPDDIDESHTGGNYVQSYNYGVFLNQEYSTSTFQRRPMVTSTTELGYKPSDRITVFGVFRQTGARYDVVYDEMMGPFGALGRSKVSAFTLFDVGASWKITKAVTVSGKLENITNEAYQEILGFQTRGRSAYLKLIFKW